MESFDGFNKDTLKFFSDIKRNNKRDWVLKNKERYQNSVVKNAALLVEALNKDKMFHHLGLWMEPTKALFRLNRDVRFSADKSLYKTYNGISMSRSGKRDETGVFYLHLEPKSSFFAVGLWMPDPKLLTRLRLKLIEDKVETEKMLKGLRKSKLKFSSEGALKRGPKGFEHIKDPVLVELLKLKSFVVVENLSDTDLLSKSLAKKASQFVQRSRALLDWAWPVVDQWRLEGGDWKNQD